MATVDRRWPASTVVCIGGGPSLTREDVQVACQHAPVIAVNDAYRLLPADKTDAVLYACDGLWWRWHRGVPSFHGPKFALTKPAGIYPDVTVLRNTGDEGLELAPSGLRTGRNSGYQAINLAVHLGARRVLLIGYDMKIGRDGQTHWFGDHRSGAVPPVALFLRHFPTIVEPLRALGVTVINCSRETALSCFPRESLRSALVAQQVAA